MAARSLEEIKEDIRSRIGHRAPFLLADRNESEEALVKLKSVEPEPWAAAWSHLAARWEGKARSEEAAGNLQSAKEAYLKAYGYYGIARHPFPTPLARKRPTARRARCIWPPSAI